MTSRIVEQRLRWFLLGLSGFMCVGTFIELILTEHTEQPIQFLPFILCGLGLAVVVAVLFHPQRKTIWALRLVMGVVAVGGLIGTFEHLHGNLEFVLETQPHAAVGETLWKVLRGAAPPFAPAILALTALVAIAATYYHPALANRSERISPLTAGSALDKRKDAC